MGIQTQRNGFGSFVQKFQKAEGKSKYGVPIFLPNGNINPAYLAAERKEEAAQKAKNVAATEAKRKKLISNGQFELADFIRKKIGEVGSGKEYYESGRQARDPRGISSMGPPHSSLSSSLLSSRCACA